MSRSVVAIVGAVVATVVLRADTQPKPLAVRPIRSTAAVAGDPDDPAIWINRSDPSRSLIVATVKVAKPKGALAAFGLDGRLHQFLSGPDRPNNVDVEYGLPLKGTPTDIAVLTERLGRRLRVYAITNGGDTIRDVSSGTMPILEGAAGEQGAPMGIGLYRRPKDGAVFAIVSPKAGSADRYLWQYRLDDDGTGRVRASLVRRFGAFSGTKEIEAVAVDDELGFVYYADERAGVHKWLADPDAPGADRELALFATSGYERDREGIGIYTTAGGRGYIVVADQRPRDSIFHVYRREGEPGRPHDHTKEIATFSGGSDQTDGVETTSTPLGPDFPDGLLVAMNSRGRNFLLYRWQDVARVIASK